MVSQILQIDPSPLGGLTVWELERVDHFWLLSLLALKAVIPFKILTHLTVSVISGFKTGS